MSTARTVRRCACIGAGLSWGVLLFFLTLIGAWPRIDGGEFVVALIVCTVVGALAGGGFGLTYTAACSGTREPPVEPGEEPGLSGLDLGVALAYSLTLTPLAVIALLGVFGRTKVLVMAMEATPLGSLGPDPAKLMLLGSLGVAFVFPLLGVFSRRPPLRRLSRFHTRALAASGFVAGMVWPGLVLGLSV